MFVNSKKPKTTKQKQTENSDGEGYDNGKSTHKPQSVPGFIFLKIT